MNVLKIIGDYCQLYRVTMPDCDLSEFNGFVAIDPTEARVLTYRRSKLLGQIVCSAMKRGTVFYLKNGIVVSLNWDMWSGFWNRHFTPEPRKENLPDPYIVKRQKPSMFEEGKATRPRKKAKSGGFAATFRVNTNIQRLGSPIPTRPIA